MAKKLLGEILIDKGLINHEQLDIALQIQKAERKLLGKVLIEKGYVQEEVILELVSEQLGIPFISLHDFPEVDPEVLTLVPKTLAYQHTLFPLYKDGNTIQVVMDNPFDNFALEIIQYNTDCEVNTAVAVRSEILEFIKKYYGFESMADETAAEAEEESAVKKKFEELLDLDSPVIKKVNALISQAVELRASDIHLEPEENYLRIRYRVDGVLQEVDKLPHGMAEKAVSRIKLMAGADIAETRVPQGGNIDIKEDGRDIQLRCSTLPTCWGEKVVLRVLDKGALVLRLADLGLGEDDLRRFQQALREPYGLILLTGPTGSGKTTTLYSAINEIISPAINITTIEDPIEYKFEMVNQVQVRKDVKLKDGSPLDFAAVLREILRQDPDVILVGEIRDEETARIAIESALTGHLIFSTLHTNDAPSSVIRLLEMGIESFLLKASLLCVVAQRLVRKLCKNCKEEYVPEQVIIDTLGCYELAGKTFSRGKGCPECNHTGYKGRVGIHETMLVNESIREMIVQNPPVEELREAAILGGMKTLRQSGLEKAYDGQTTLEEVARVTSRGF